MISSNPKPRLSLFGLARQQRRPEPPAVTIVPIARGHAGKTACLRTLHAGIRDGLPSGLRDEIEKGFQAASKDASLIKPLGKLLHDHGLFERFQDRFFELIQKR